MIEVLAVLVYGALCIYCGAQLGQRQERDRTRPEIEDAAQKLATIEEGFDELMELYDEQMKELGYAGTE